MAKKGKSGKSDSRAARSAGAEAATERPVQSFQVMLDENTIMTIRISLTAAPVIGKGPRLKKDELLLTLMATLTALFAGKTPRPKKRGLVFEPMAGAPVIGPGRKRVNP